MIYDFHLQMSRQNFRTQNYFRQENPEYFIDQQRLDENCGALQRAWSNHLQRCQNRLQLSSARLEAYDPAGVLKRGFAILLKDDNSVADSVSKLSSGEHVRARLYDGNVDLQVK